MFRNLNAYSESFTLASPFRIARGVRTVAEIVIVEIAVGGMVGCGES